VDSKFIVPEKILDNLGDLIACKLKHPKKVTLLLGKANDFLYFTALNIDHGHDLLK
jgi:hypothetical protein